jgi:tetratricopeptide (TPR) repeat protein
MDFAGFAELERLRRGVDAALSAPPGERDADAWERTAAGYAHEVGVLPSRELLPGLLADFGEIGERLAGSSGHIRHRLARAAGQLAALMAIALTNLGDSGTARRWWRTAARAADEAGDYRAAALVRGRHAVFALYGSRPAATALGLADEAIAVGRDAPCAGVASGYAARAQALAQLGRSQDARHTLHNLAGVFERLPEGVSADRWSVWGWSEMRLRHVESYVYTRAGDVKAAGQAQDVALKLYPAHTYQGRTQIELHRAECLIRAGDIDGGAQHARQVLGQLPPERRSDALVTGTAVAALRAVPPQHGLRPAVRSARELLALPAGQR